MAGGKLPRGAPRALAYVVIVGVGASCGARTELDVALGPLAPAGEGAASGAGGPDMLHAGAMDAGAMDAARPDAAGGAQASDASADAREIPRDCVDVCKPGQSRCVAGLMSSCIAGVERCWTWDTPVTCVANRVCQFANGQASCVPP
jgi:hypothetical protein